MSHTETILWQSAERLPDSDLSVLVYAPACDEPVWIGFYDGDGWVSADGAMYRKGHVKAWANLPAGPDATSDVTHTLGALGRRQAG